MVKALPSLDRFNCLAELLAIQASSDVIIQPAESRQQTSEDIRGMINDADDKMHNIRNTNS